VISHNTDVIDAAESAAYRPRLSRETRRLLLTALVAVLALWALARVRFPDRPPAPNPVPPILDQLTIPPTFADLAARVAELRARLTDSLVSVVLVRDRTDGEASTPPDRVAALRIRDDLAVTIVVPAERHAGAAPLGVIAEDRGSGLTLVQTSMKTRPTLPIFWSPRDLEQPRYALASATSPRDISLRPVFIASLSPIEIPQWSDPVWALPMDAAVTPGALLFTEQGELVGVVAPYDAGLAVVPARILLAAAERLLEAPQKAAADLGIDIEPLTARLAIAAGAETGVVVAWVNPSGIAAPMLRAGDVIQSIDDMEIGNTEQFRVRAARASVGDTLTLRVTRHGAQRTVQLTIPPPPDQSTSTLGLTMRRVGRVGTEVMRVDPRSAADAAGILAGDLVTAIGSITAPTPAQVRSAFASMKQGDLLIVAVRRGGAHRVVAIQR
jgi:PDZ domain-containing protein